MQNILFATLEAGTLKAGKPFVGFAEGEFVDMFGREAKIEDEHMPDYLSNTLDLITDYKARGMPGLPIDEMGHNMGKAAGWITGALETTVTDTEGRLRKAIQFVAEWTKLGIEMVTEKIMTNFSPNVDLTNKVIEGGTLTNWPASIDGRGVPLFNAIELSQGLRALQRPSETSRKTDAEETGPAASDRDVQRPSELSKGELPMSEEQKKQTPDGEPEVTDAGKTPKGQAPEATPQATPREPAADPQQATELLEALFSKVPALAQSRPEQLAELVQQLSTQMAERQVQRLIEEQQQQWEITELAAKLTGGGLRGLPVTIPELTEFFLSLDPVQFESAKAIFGKITSHGLIDFQEIGHGRRLRRKPLPEEYHAHLQDALKAGHTVEAFFNEAGLGDPSGYDLSQFKGE